MKLGDATVNIANVFSGKNQYQIPFYQRRYVWDNVNWRPLWEDIIQFPDKHFAGTIITYEQATNSIEIVDGQQRLTTFQIIFCIIRDLLDLEKSGSMDIARKKSEIIGYVVQDVQEEPPRIVLTKRDNPAFMEVFSGNLWKRLNIQNIEGCRNAFESLQNGEQHPITTAYGFFGSKIIGYLDMCENSDKKFKNLQKLADILKDFRVIKAELDSESGYDPEEIFQIINDTGRMLDDFDYLRNYLFLRTKKYLQNEDVTKNEDIAEELNTLYDGHWDKFEGEDWDSEKLKLFFQAFLIAKLGPTRFEGEDRDIQPFDCYRKHIQTIEEGQAEKFSPLLQLSCYADSYGKLNSSDQLTKGSDLRKLGHRMRFYDALKLPRLDWFLLFMKHNSNLSDEDLNKLCNILESYIVRGWLHHGEYDSSYKEINGFFNSGEVNVPNFVEHLSHSWPCRESVEEMLKEWAFNGVEPDLVRYILYRIELKVSNCSSSPLNFESMPNLEQIVESSVLLTPPVSCTPDEVLSAANSIGNIKSPTFNGQEVSTITDIYTRTNSLLDCFNKIWKPEVEDCS